MIDDPTVNAAVVAATCPDCGDALHPCETICAACGAHLSPKNSTAVGGTTLDGTDAADGMEVTLPMSPKCSCGGRGLCTVCVLDEYDNGRDRSV